ncbi:hypothetical protein GQF01_15560 [Paenibacillus sp. 5J-6]|uniref:Uncharacterized protein n=1 Tax=Paenibacillus silvestris TaxID=2606219 RepID=A0A6L8V2N6_9BACL|nr:hypothetical protein [Paenibacillus silvestris]MZQ83529.1 hypothetical protein [Paenibacillus silvestris]
MVELVCVLVGLYIGCLVSWLGGAPHSGGRKWFAASLVGANPTRKPFEWVKSVIHWSNSNEMVGIDASMADLSRHRWKSSNERLRKGD